jgi:anti-anti-sigma factor
MPRCCYQSSRASVDTFSRSALEFLVPHHDTDVRSSGRLFLIIEKRSRSTLTILDIQGAIRLGESAEFFSQTLEKVLRNETTNVVIDFTRIHYIDSTGIGELIGYLLKFAGEDRQVILVNPSERISRLLKVVRLDKVLKIFLDEDSAVAYAEAQGTS